MIRVEIELQGQSVPDEIFDLRNYLKEQLPDADFFIKEQPLADGQMGEIESLIGGILHASTAIIIEELYQNLLKPLLNAWLKKRRNAGVQLEVMSSLTGNEEKIHFLEDANGNTQVYNLKYAIDTDKTFALLIGAGKFTSGFHDIPPVKGNLQDFYKLLTDKKHIGIPRDRVVISYNEPNVEIQKRLLHASRMQDLQTLIIYFAGHGHRTDVKKLTLIAADSEKIDDDIIGGIDFDFISNKVLKKAVANQKILILDTCHSGIATQGSDDVAVNFDVKGSYILTSSPGDEVSYFEKNAKHTYFTGALLDVLQNGIDNTNDMLTLEDLFDYTKNVLSEKDFPHPNSKSELNIPPANFYIARNPSFSGEKLKWRAGNLFRDGKMEEAMDEYRMLLKRFPQDENLRKQFEECETELSFSKLVHEANALFYQAKNYQQAAAIYKRAYKLKKDAMVMEKIRQCEQQPASLPIPDALTAIKANTNFIAFRKAQDRKAFYAAWQHLKNLKKNFPNSNYVNEEIQSAESIWNKIADSRNDERLAVYFQQLDKGELRQAHAELKSQIRNDPEYPEFLKLQQALLRKIQEKNNTDKEQKESVLFRLFKTFPKKAQAITIIIIAVLVVIIFLLNRDKENYNLSELKNMLIAEPDKAIELLKAKEDDSAKLVLGNYYSEKSRYDDAYAIYLECQLPAAKSAIGRMFYFGPTFGKTLNSDSAKIYFKDALKTGVDTAANYYLGMMALENYHKNFDTTNSSDFWDETINYFKEGYKDSCVRCRDSLSSLDLNRGIIYLSINKNEAERFFTEAASYKNAGAMHNLGKLYSDTSWTKYDISEAQKWYKNAIEYKYEPAFNNLAVLLIRKNFTAASYDSAYNLLSIAEELKPDDPSIYFNRGIIFERGGGTFSKNIDSALYFYHKAASFKDFRRHEDAEAYIKRLSGTTIGN